MEVGGLFRKTKGVLYRTPFKHTRQTRNNISARPIVYETKTSILSKFFYTKGKLKMLNFIFQF